MLFKNVQVSTLSPRKIPKKLTLSYIMRNVPHSNTFEYMGFSPPSKNLFYEFLLFKNIKSKLSLNDIHNLTPNHIPRHKLYLLLVSVHRKPALQPSQGALCHHIYAVFALLSTTVHACHPT